MTAPATVVAPAPGRPSIRLLGRHVVVVLPSRHDPRFKVSAVVLTLHVLGQTVLDFKVSIAQIAVSIVVCAFAEAAVTYRSVGQLVWPASGILTGSSVAFILRASGTQHGDWWSLHGIHFFVLAGIISLLSKHLIRPTGRHLFNPSNVGIVWCLLVIGPNHVFPQYLWWGPNNLGVALAYGVILLGAAWILRSIGMIPMAVSFLVTFALLIGALAAAGRSFIAIWHEGPISGLPYWANIVLSPELLVFVFFMISDPQTAPKAPVGRLVYGVAIAATAAALISFQPTEFGIKVAILSSLTAVSALVPLIEWFSRRFRHEPSSPLDPTPASASLGRRLLAAGRRPAVLATVVVAVAAPVDTAVLAGNDQVLLLERGQIGAREAQ